MPEHLIRLRGGWEFLGTEGRTRPAWVSLPLPVPPGGPRRIRLSRAFQNPPIDPRRETLWLRLDAVPGLFSVVLNDLEVAREPFPLPPILLPLVENLPSRNRLILDVEFSRRPDDPSAGAPWGEVALVIRGRVSGDDD